MVRSSLITTSESESLGIKLARLEFVSPDEITRNSWMLLAGFVSAIAPGEGRLPGLLWGSVCMLERCACEPGPLPVEAVRQDLGIGMGTARNYWMLPTVFAIAVASECSKA